MNFGFVFVVVVVVKAMKCNVFKVYLGHFRSKKRFAGWGWD